MSEAPSEQVQEERLQHQILIGVQVAQALR